MKKYLNFKNIINKIYNNIDEIIKIHLEIKKAYSFSNCPKKYKYINKLNKKIQKIEKKEYFYLYNIVKYDFPNNEDYFLKINCYEPQIINKYKGYYIYIKETLSKDGNHGFLIFIEKYRYKNSDDFLILKYKNNKYYEKKIIDLI